MTAWRTKIRLAAAILGTTIAALAPQVGQPQFTVDASAYGDEPLADTHPAIRPSPIREQILEVHEALRDLETQEIEAQLDEGRQLGEIAIEHFIRRHASIEREYARAVTEMTDRYHDRVKQLRSRLRDDDKRLQEEIKRARDDATLEFIASLTELLGSLGAHLYTASQRESEPKSEPGKKGLHVREGVFQKIVYCETDGGDCVELSNRSLIQESHRPDAESPLPHEGAEVGAPRNETSGTGPPIGEAEGMSGVGNHASSAHEAGNKLPETAGAAMRITAGGGQNATLPPDFEAPQAIVNLSDDFLKEIRCDETTRSCTPVWANAAGHEEAHVDPESPAGKDLYRKLAAMGSFGLDLSPVARAKAFVEIVVGRDAVTGEDLPRWIAALGLLPGGKPLGKTIRFRIALHPSSKRLASGSMKEVFERYLKGTGSTVTGAGGVTREVAGNIFSAKVARMRAQAAEVMNQLKRVGQTNGRLRLKNANVKELMKLGQAWVCGGRSCKVTIGTTQNGGVALIPANWRKKTTIKRFRISEKKTGIEGNMEWVDLTNVQRRKSIRPTIYEEARHNLHLEL